MGRAKRIRKLKMQRRILRAYQLFIRQHCAKVFDFAMKNMHLTPFFKI